MMPHELTLLPRFKKSGWKIKIRDKERLEPPHLTVLRKADQWRICLRDCGLLDGSAWSWSELPRGIRRAIELACQELRGKWDEMYPENPVGGEDE